MPVFGALVEERYGKSPVVMQPLPSTVPGRRHVYRIELGDGQRWIMKARRQDLPPMGPPYDMPRWIRARTAVLGHLEARGYPAPRVIRTRDGELVEAWEGWHALVTTFVEGTIAHLTPDLAQLSGESLARLHLTTVGPSGAGPLAGASSWWEPTHAVPTCLAQLASTADSVPRGWRDVHDAFSATLTAVRSWPALPESVIHADCWAGNIVRTGPDLVVLIDWDCAGLGPAVLDLGDLLIGCHFRLDDPYAHEVQPDPSRIAAVADGYGRLWVPTTSELDVLDDAVRYGSAFRGARTFGRVLQEGWSADIEQELGRQRHRYLASGEIARIARARFADPAPRILQTPGEH